MMESEELKNSHGQWVVMAKELLESARILRDAFENSLLTQREGANEKNTFEMIGALRSHLMLRAFALECFYKAIWLSRGNKLFEDGSFKGVDGHKRHDLEELAKAVKLYDNLSDIQKRVLSVLSQFNERGRYPVLKQLRQDEKLLGWCVSNHDPAFEEIVAMLEAELGVS